MEEQEKKITDTRKVWKTGTDSIVFTIEKAICNYLEIKAGDYIEVTIKKLDNKQKIESKKTKEQIYKETEELLRSSEKMIKDFDEQKKKLNGVQRWNIE